MEIKEITADDDVSAFTCGDSDLDEWVKTKAFDNHENGFGATYLAHDDGEIVAFLGITTTSVKRGRVQKKKRGRTPSHWPAMVIARMGVLRSRQRSGIGEKLLRHALELAEAQRRAVGCSLVIVDAKADAVDFYRKYGFEDILTLDGDPPPPDGATTLFMPIATVRQAIRDAAPAVAAQVVATATPI